MTLAATSPIVDWNPLSAAGDTTGQRQQQWPFYPHPFLTNPDTSVVLNAALLESAEVVSTAPMTIKYKIQQKAVWSDGTPISGKDFEYTQAVQDPEKCAECKAAFTEGYSLIDSVQTSSDGKTVTMTYSKPFSEWQALFNYILPAHVADTYGNLAASFNEGFGKNAPKVSGGPYIIKEVQDGVSMTMVKNPKWYGDPAHLDTITTRYISGQGAQITALQNGEIDLVYQNPTLDTVTQVKAMSGTTMRLGSTLTYFHLGMKTTGDVMADAALRKAISTRLNLDDMRKRTVGQYAPELTTMKSSVYVPGQKVGDIAAYQENIDALNIGKGDTKAALGILEQAGYKLTNGKLMLPDGKPLRDLTMLTLSTDVLRMELAQITQSQLKDLGIAVVIDAADGARYSPALRSGSFDLMATGTALDLGALSMQQWYGTGGARSFGYSSTEADRLFEAASTELDPAKRVDLMNQVDRVLMADGVVLPLFASPQMAAYSDKFANIFINPSKYGTTMNVEHWGLRK
ncbi:putative monoacyl phosphatidylinositol tetramannoside-binding protein LpqW precursor [Micromonospora sp. MW-13]|uniref:ABC transporter family substrate-binding protein n=1 Tax=unclassified Micromonospora TaxID=2617518 RepID=UPI000E43D06C|nr:MULTISPECIES: ABC transporter family substrate-binding protein [unclassified Micromonospora]MCX4471515.1 ABC transporter family substrate-binding protein [Micromonospora sp. NBC_01655]RGC65627.1 putative monoacyl phosphatidylinositol tetramannoside-binding protein LpqW precursor [Micromonospora sp. MW-13]